MGDSGCLIVGLLPYLIDIITVTTMSLSTILLACIYFIKSTAPHLIFLGDLVVMRIVELAKWIRQWANASQLLRAYWFVRGALIIFIVAVFKCKLVTDLCLASCSDDGTL